MKILLWLVTLFIAALWTLGIAVMASAAGWLASQAGAGAGVGADWATQLAQFPLPAWIESWLNTVWVEQLRASSVQLLGWLGKALPAASPILGWIAPLLWIIWAIVLLPILALAVGAHFMLRKWNNTPVVGR